jgi:glyceraldehyde-3-phosphate dehydrogenase (NADP+)
MELKARIEQVFPDAGQIPRRLLDGLPVVMDRYLLSGKLHRWNGPWTQVQSPVWVQRASGAEPLAIGSYPDMGQPQALAALEAAFGAYGNGRGHWPTRSVADRIRQIQAFATVMQTQKSAVVTLLMWEVGKSLEDSEKEFDRTVQYIADTIDALKDLDRVSSRFSIAQGIIGQIRRGPLGVVLCMGPFNYPLNETFATLIPALIMGNTVVFKPPKHGVLLYQPLLAAFAQCFPPGVVNVVTGSGATVIPPLMATGKISVLALIGTSRVADILRKQHPRPHRLRCVLGMEAKNAAIVLADADLDLAVSEAILGTLSFNGQRCTALKLLFVHESIAASFLTRFSDALSKIRFGMPWEPRVLVTPVAEPGKPAYLADLVADATAGGAAVINADGATVNGSFFYPALMYPVKSTMRLFHEEQFGPVIPVVPFTDIETPIAAIVDSNFGQQLSIFGTDAKAIAELIDPLVNQVCRLNINSQCQRGPDIFPFTGRKDSAEGTLSVSDALRAFSIRSLVAAKETTANKEIITQIVTDRMSNFLSTDFIL